MAQSDRPLPEKPLPQIRTYTERYWRAAKDHVLEMPRCISCGKYHFYPRSICPHCWSDELEWRPVSGKGKIYTFTIVTQAATPAFAADVPYVFAVVELEEGPHMSTNVIGCKPDEVTIGSPVEVVFDDVTSDITLPKFRLIKAE